jgi:hypothetical protein
VVHVALICPQADYDIGYAGAGILGWGIDVTDEEIEAVAEELAKAGGVSWYPGRTNGPLLRPVNERYRDRARLAIAALDRVRAGRDTASEPSSSEMPVLHDGVPATPLNHLQVGATVVYRPPGDKRAIACRIEQLEGGRAYLVPCSRPDVGWVSLDTLSPLGEGAPKEG